MNWIKKNPAKFSLIVAAVLAIASSALLVTRVLAYDENFEAKRAPAPAKVPVEKLNLESLEATQKAIGEPAKWVPKDLGSLLVSRLYVLKDDKLIKPEKGSFNPPVPNDWLASFGLDFLSKTVLDEDPDKDGFTTRQEWNGMDTVSHLDEAGQRLTGTDGKELPDDSTDPKDPKSHPPYHTRLELARIVYIPFRLKMLSYDINPKKTSDITAQINTIDRGRRTLFIPVGEDIPGTKFKTESFKKIELPGKDGTVIDASELTIVNKETGGKVIMPLGKEVDSPDSHAVFRYLWVAYGGTKTEDFPVIKNKVFHLPPELDKDYKLIDIKGKEAVVELPGGEKKTFVESK